MNDPIRLSEAYSLREWHKWVMIVLLPMSLTWGLALRLAIRVMTPTFSNAVSTVRTHEKARFYSASEALAARPCLDTYWRQFDFSRATVDWAPIYSRARGNVHYGNVYTTRHDAIFNAVD